MAALAAQREAVSAASRDIIAERHPEVSAARVRVWGRVVMFVCRVCLYPNEVTP